MLGIVLQRRDLPQPSHVPFLTGEPGALDQLPDQRVIDDLSTQGSLHGCEPLGRDDGEDFRRVESMRDFREVRPIDVGQEMKRKVPLSL